MRMRTLLLGLAVLPLAVVAQAGPEGRWKTIDDETGNAKSIVEISRAADGSLQGTVAEILQSDSGPDPVCDECSGERKDQPIEGMTILWDLEQDGDSWSGGTILDPANGKTYRSKAQMLDDDRLGVSGCIAFFCREQVWQRE